MFAISTLIKRASGKSTFHNGVLFPLPLELRDKPRMERYESIAKGGWIIGEFNYQTYAKATGTGDFYIFPGLRISDGPSVKKRFYGYTVSFTRAEIESLAQGIVDFSKETEAVVRDDLNLLVHDLRALSSSIYNSAIEAETFIDSRNLIEARKRIENVKAAQAMLKMRTDALDFVGNPASIIGSAEIPVYKKVDKVIRIFMSRSTLRGRFFELRGPSVGRVIGPDLFELVPYTLIDNALKYSPPETPIEIDVNDGEDVVLSVGSYGPRIDEDEMEEIFKKGIRGRHAISAGRPGSGVGLHILDKIIREHFGGKILVHQDKVGTQLGGEYPVFFTKFIVVIPRAG